MAERRYTKAAARRVALFRDRCNLLRSFGFMPTYAYRGTACAHEFETYQAFSEDPLSVCLECGGPVRRVIQPTGIVFKGSGWYITDSRKSSSSSTTADAEPKAADAPAKETPASTATADKVAAD